MSLRHLIPETRAEVRVGNRVVAVEETDGSAYVLVDGTAIEMHCRLHESFNSQFGETSDEPPPYKPAQTFQLEEAPASHPEVRTYAMGTVLLQWEIPKGFLRVEITPDFTRADVEVYQTHNV
ncbi:MAG TPA: hypothetical protein VIV11_13575 [Kofleriaceae bacterium]